MNIVLASWKTEARGLLELNLSYIVRFRGSVSNTKQNKLAMKSKRQN